jgi:hypothetical protein
MPGVPPGVPGHSSTIVVTVLQYRKPDGTRGFDETGKFEVICPDCGDDRSLYYDEVSPELQRLRGPYNSRETAERKLMEHRGNTGG